MVCYKHRFVEDPVYGTDRAHLTTTMWSDPIVGRPETQLTGVTFTRGGYHRIARSVRRGSGGYEIHRPDHWLLEGTRLARGDLLGAASTTVGYECDGCDLTLRDGLPVATGADGTPPRLRSRRAPRRRPRSTQHDAVAAAPGGGTSSSSTRSGCSATTRPRDLGTVRNGHAVLGTFERPWHRRDRGDDRVGVRTRRILR